MYRCECCCWWNGFDIGPEGQCRKHAPVVLVGCEGQSIWPITNKKNWCGDAKFLYSTTQKKREELKQSGEMK